MTIENFNFAGKKAIVRVDFNVPLNENGDVTDETRIKGALPTLKKVLADGGALIMMSHYGRDALVGIALFLSSLAHKGCKVSELRASFPNYLTGENRILAHYGLKQLNEAPRKGLEAMIRLTGIDKSHLSIDDIVFKIGPRINAAGRMESGRIAVELLTATDEETANRIGSEINRHNNERKDIDRKTTQEAVAMVESGKVLKGLDDISLKHTTIVYNPDWHKGVVGIVASRLVEYFYRPTVVFTRSKDFVTGSARSVHGFSTAISLGTPVEPLVRTVNIGQSLSHSLMNSSSTIIHRLLSSTAYQYCQ